MTAPVYGPAERPSIFRGILRDPRDVEAPEGSQNAQLLALRQRRRVVGDMRGHLLLLPRTGLVVMPYDTYRPVRDSDTRDVVVPARPADWRCIVVDGAACTTDDGQVPYPRGGHDIAVSELEMTTAVDLTEGEGEWTPEGLHRPTVAAVLAVLSTALADAGIVNADTLVAAVVTALPEAEPIR